MPDPAHLAWACEECKSIRPEDIDPYTAQVLWLLRLKKGGYPFGPDDLDLQTFHDMGLAAEALKQAEEIRRWQATLKHSTFGSRSAPKA